MKFQIRWFYLALFQFQYRVGRIGIIHKPQENPCKFTAVLVIHLMRYKWVNII